MTGVSVSSESKALIAVDFANNLKRKASAMLFTDKRQEAKDHNAALITVDTASPLYPAEATNSIYTLIWSTDSPAVNNSKQEIANKTITKITSKPSNSASYRATPPPRSSDSQCSVFLKSKPPLSINSEQIATAMYREWYV